MTASNLTVLTGANRGLGFAMACQLASEGGHLITLSRKPSPQLQSLAKEHQTELTEINVDLADASMLQAAAQTLHDAIEQSVGQANSCRIIHNAGIVAPIEPADQLTDLQIIRAAFDVNIAAPIFLTAHFLQATKGNSDRRIMLVSSGAGRNPTGSWGVYCATKAALDHYGNVLKAENHPDTRISSVAPGVIDTGMQVQIRSTPAEKFPSVGRFADMHQNGVLADAEVTAAKMLRLLASDDFGQKTIDDVRNYA